MDSEKKKTIDSANYVVNIHYPVVDAYYGATLGEKLTHEIKQRIHWICSNVKGQNVLDVGCNQITMPIILAREGIKVIGVNANPHLIEKAIRYRANELLHVQDKIEFINTNFISYDFKKLNIQTVIISEIIENLIRPQQFIDAAAKLLPNDGRLIITVPFGVNDFIEYKHTFYLLKPFQIISQYFEIQEIKIFGKWLGIVANKKNVTTSNLTTITFTETQIEQLENAFFQIEHNLRDELAAIQVKLANANQKYQIATKKEEARKKSFRTLEKAYKQSKEAQIKLRNKNNILKQKVKQLQLKNQTNNTISYETEKQIINLQTNFNASQEQLKEINQLYHTAIQQIDSLQHQITQKETTSIQDIKDNIQVQSTEIQTELQHECSVLRQEVERLQIHLQQLDTVKNALENANNKYRFVTNQLEKLKQDLSQKEKVHSETEKLLQQAYEKLEQVNLKYRKLTSEIIPKLKNELEKLQQQKIAADEQVVKTRATLSFQLGYLLIEHSKSLRGMITLPSALWEWRKEVLRRREKTKQRQKVLEIIIPNTSPLPLTKKEKKQNRTNQQQSIEKVLVTEDTSPILPSSVLVTDTELNLRQLKVACIMDEFTFNSYQPECTLQQLTPEHWKAELEAFQPELLFIESAWRGKNELWGNKVGHTSQELQGIVAWCQAKKIPTVFWNKEDPIHFETFLTTARLFDYVFTTDIDCIHRYKAVLGHNHVYLLPFACQPATNNPIETYERKDAFCFAGAYYVRYPERTHDLGNFVRTLPNFRPLEIYDRNFGKNDPNYKFPSEYQSFIVGTLPFNQIDKAYKGYRYAINLNSIKQSQSMFARRVFELLASNTVTVSNFSRGVRLLFGDLVITTDSGNEMVHQLNKMANNETQSRKLRLAALRKVMQEHTYEHRMAYIVSKITGHTQNIPLPTIVVFAFVNTDTELDNILYYYQQQRYVHRRLLVVTGKNIKVPTSAAGLNIQITPLSKIKDQTLNTVIGDNADWLATMMPQDYYGPNYLLDIALTTRYSKADVIGKGAAHYNYVDGLPVLQHSEAAYRPINQLPARSAAIRLSMIADISLSEWLNNLSEKIFKTDNGLGIDEFNYCRNGSGTTLRDVVATAVDDIPELNTGIDINELLVRAEAIAPAVVGLDECPVLTGKQLAANFGKPPSTAIKLDVEYDSWQVTSSLSDGKHEYLYATTEHSLKDLGINDQFKFYLEVSPGLNIQLVIVFLDAQKQKISHVIKHPNRNHEVDIPTATVSIRLGLRFYANGSAEIKGLVLGHRNLQPPEIIGQAEHLVLTNHYPSYEDLYQNGFVHSRVRAYREQNVRCDVFRLRPEEAVSYHEFEDVDVITGSQEALHKMLCNGHYKSVLVHFLDSAMWEVLKYHINNIKVVVWVHGAEIQPWHRRDFNNQTEEQRTVAKMKSEKRMAFWRELLKNIPKNLKLVFVSKYFAQEVMEDLGFRIPEDHYTIIHNPINTELFSYNKKPVEQRKKVLSIRPYASAKYANDLSVQAIQLLAQKPWFSQIEFRIIGDGALFEETLAPLRKFTNVHIEQTFLKQDEIANLHKKYGIFLCPTRMDAQGVSRDEAMSSGLVPITNAVTAIPEFVDDECGILAPSEGAKEMAAGITMLFESPEKFSMMSKAAAARVRHQSDFKIIISKELELFSSITLHKAK